MSTPQLLLAAYVTATGIPVTLSQTREMSLTQLVQVGATPEDVLAVITELKRLMKKKPEVYDAGCLEFRRCMADPDRFEDRMLRLRQEALRKRPAAKPVPREQSDGKGVLRVLDAPVPEEPKQIDPAVIADQFLSLSQEFGKRRLA